MRGRRRRLVVSVGLSLLLFLPWVPGLHLNPAPPTPGTLDDPRSLGAPPAPALPGGSVDPRAGSGQGRMLIVSTDTAAVPNDGLRVNLTAFAPLPFAPDSSFQEGVSETIGGYDAVFGLFQNWLTPPVPFFSVFSNTTDANVHLAYWTNVTLFTGRSYDFELTPTNGTVWTLTVNGAQFGGNASLANFDFQATTSTWLGGLSFSEIALYPNATTTPPVAAASLVMAVHHPEGWYLPQEGQTTFTGSPGAAWGVEGRFQHPSLAPGAVVTGTSVATVPNGTVLWTGGPVPVTVALAVPASAVGSGAATARATITDPLGLPIPGAAVYFSDALGGSFTPASVLTNSTGGALALFETPNVSTNASDLVVATVTTFGYGGFSGHSVDLTPAEQLFVDLVDGSTALAPGDSVLLTFRVTDGSGAAVVGVYLSFSVDHGTIAPALAPTDGDGRVGATVASPATATTVTLRVTVTASGAWGSTVVHLGPQTDARSFWSAYGWYLAAVGVAGLLVLLVAALLVRRRRQRQTLPPMNLRREPAGANGSEPSDPGATRRPPGSCSP